MGWELDDEARAIAATTATQIAWGQDRGLKGGGIDALATVSTGANNCLDSAGAAAQQRVKVGSNPIIDLNGAQVRALMESESESQTPPAAGRLNWCLPIFPRGFEGLCGIPFGSDVIFEYGVDATSSAGFVKASWRRRETEWRPKFMPHCVTRNTGIGATTVPGVITIAPPVAGALLYGVLLPIVGATGLLRARIVADGEQLANLRQGQILAEAFRVQPTTLTVNVFHRSARLRPVNNALVIELETGAASLATDQIAPYWLIPLGG